MASGTISFGLVAIPVKLYSSGESATNVSFNMVHKDCGTRLKYRYYCPTDDRFVEQNEIVKGYEYAKGQYVLFSDEELKALTPEPTNAIEIHEFVPLEQVDPVYFEKSYYLGPDKGGARPYRLLAEALKVSGRAALGKYAARGKSYLVLLRPFENGLVLQQLRYATELKSFTEVDVPDAEVKESELKLALQLIAQTASDEFKPAVYKDEQTDRTWELIQKKVDGQELVAAPEEAPKAQIIDLMAALKASLGLAAEEPMAEARKPAKRSPAGKAAADEEAPAVRPKKVAAK
jgi:DNA end-binding protein Ku